MARTGKTSEIKRLEVLWAGAFGNEYNERNKNTYGGRGAFWKTLLKKLSVKNILEIGCNVGGNLQWAKEMIPSNQVWGVDINEEALQKLRGSLPGVNVVWSAARDLPFRDNFFDLVFTAGVLIHQPDSSLIKVMSEAVRCSRRYVLCLEYFSDLPVEVFYRGNQGALFKRNYGKIYQKHFRNLRLVKQDWLGKAEGWDDVTYWLFKKRD